MKTSAATQRLTGSSATITSTAGLMHYWTQGGGKSFMRRDPTWRGAGARGR